MGNIQAKTWWMSRSQPLRTLVGREAKIERTKK